MEKISDRIYSVGVNDLEKTLFEGLWPIPYGVSYNSYLVVDEKVALIDTVEYGFDKEYLENIKYYCLVMSENYIRNHFTDIKKYANVIENRLEDELCTLETDLADNAEMMFLAQKHNVNYILIDDQYEINIDL